MREGETTKKPVLMAQRLKVVNRRITEIESIVAREDQGSNGAKALDAMRERDGRRFFLKNTAPNLAGAELQELVRTAVESNGGRITTSQNQVPRDEGRFRQISVSVQFFASTPALQKILYAIEASPPYLLIENMTLRPLNAFRGFKPVPGQEPEVNVQLDAAGYAVAEPARK